MNRLDCEPEPVKEGVVVRECEADRGVGVKE